MKYMCILVFFILNVGCAYNQKVLTPAELTYGEEQVRAMLADRKIMSFYKDKSGKSHQIGSDDEIWKWAATMFAGQSLNRFIEWAPETKFEKCALANNTSGTAKTPHIWVSENILCGERAGTKLRFEHLWRLAIFELLNTEGSDQFKKIQDELKACIPMTKEEYIRKKLSIEYQALVKQISFYKNVWLPWANKNSFKSSPGYWSTDLQPLDMWLEFLKNHPSSE